MATLKVEQLGEHLVIRLTAEAKSALGVRVGDEVRLERTLNGEVSLASADMDHQMRLERSRAFIRHLRH